MCVFIVQSFIRFIFVIKLLTVTLFASYDFFEQAERSLQSSPLNYKIVLKKYLDTLKPIYSKSINVEEDAPSVYGGQLSIIKKLKEVNVAEALDAYHKLVEVPDLTFYKEVLTQLNVSSSLFKPYLENNRLSFGVRVLQLLEKTHKYSRNNFPLQNRSNINEENINKVIHLNEIEEDLTNSGHKLMSGSSGIQDRAATLDERKKMIEFLLFSVKDALERGEDNIAHILALYDLKKTSLFKGNREVLSNHIKICREILGTVFYILKHKKSSLNKTDKTKIQEILGYPSTTNIALFETIFSEEQIVSFLKENLPNFTGFEDEIQKKKETIPTSSFPVNTNEDEKATHLRSKQFLQEELSKFEKVFKLNGNSEHFNSIQMTMKLCSIMYEQADPVLKYAGEIYTAIKEKKTIHSPQYKFLKNNFSDENYLFRELLEEYIVMLQAQAQLPYAPVFETIDVLGLTGNKLPNKETFQEVVLGTVQLHLKDGMKMLWKASNWLGKNPTYLKDFFRNAFFNTYEGCLPKKNVYLSDWITSRTKSDEEGKYIYDHFISMYSGDFLRSIGYFLNYFRDMCLINLLKKNSARHYQYMTDEDLDKLEEYQRIYNQNSFAGWVTETARKAYQAKKYDSLFSSSPYSNKEKIVKATDMLYVF